jgi:hypothetical protein
MYALYAMQCSESVTDALCRTLRTRVRAQALQLGRPGMQNERISDECASAPASSNGVLSKS